MNNFIATLNAQFSQTHLRNCAFARLIPVDKIFWQPRQTANAAPVYSCGEYLLRSAAVVEQTFGGLTASLWDDPFEWTLPEELATNEKILAYLNEVEATRLRGFALFTADADLQKELLVFSKQKTIFALLIDTLARAENYQGRAFAAFRSFSDASLPRWDS